MRVPPTLPPPLLSNGDATADALRIGNRDFAASIDEAAAFVSLSQRVQRQRPQTRVLQFALPAFAVLAAAVAIVALRPRPVVTILAEPLARAPSAPATGSVAVRDKTATPPTLGPEEGDTTVPSASQQRLARDAVDRPVLPSRSGLPAPQRAGPAAKSLAEGEAASGRPWSPVTPAVAFARSVASERTSEPQPEKPTAEMLEAAPAGPDCLLLARQGSTREAEQCFAERARGSGLGAEMALYELGRLRRNVLADPRGALLALEEYGARFPSGSLRKEVEMSYLELLVQVGRSREALERSSALLEAPSGAERAAELHLLRGDVFRRSLRDLRAAEREYGLSEQLSGSAEATYLRGVCLEALQEHAAASEAYQRYLGKPSRPRTVDVQQRLRRLSSP